MMKYKLVHYFFLFFFSNKHNSFVLEDVCVFLFLRQILSYLFLRLPSLLLSLSLSFHSLLFIFQRKRVKRKHIKKTTTKTRMMTINARDLLFFLFFRYPFYSFQPFPIFPVQLENNGESKQQFQLCNRSILMAHFINH